MLGSTFGLRGRRGERGGRAAALAVALLWLAACGGETTESADAAESSASALRERAAAILGSLPTEPFGADDPTFDAKIDLGRMLYFDERLSKNQDISCNSCHQLDRYGVDAEPTSPGHRGQRGDRNSPTVYNAYLHIAQFWDGRAADVEEQAKGPVLNPIEMAMPSEAAVVALLESIPGYVSAFAAAFPDEAKPVTYDNMAIAIGAFERRLVTPGRFDAFLAGDDRALSPAELVGLDEFLNVGCTTCHRGALVGGGLYQKLGLIKPYPTEDPGRQKVTGLDADLHKFKVPSLRNVAKTGPYLHDGSIPELDQMVRLMAEHQLGKSLSDEQVDSILTFLGALTANMDPRMVAVPALPPSGPDTPGPDPT